MLCIQTTQDSLCAGYAIHTLTCIVITIHCVEISCHPAFSYMQAYEQGIFYPRNLFLFYGWYSDNWWVGSDSEGLSCSLEERERVVSSGLAIVNDEALSDCYTNISTGIMRYIISMPCKFTFGFVHLQDGYTFEKAVEELLDNSSVVNSSTVHIYSQNCYDATWILAMALNESITSEQYF